MAYTCVCPTCVGRETGTCIICWERPYAAMDMDGELWDVCWPCMARENPMGVCWPVHDEPDPSGTIWWHAPERHWSYVRTPEMAEVLGDPRQRYWRPFTFPG